MGALTALGEQLGRSGITADLYVVGGAAIALAYDERRSTRDVVLNLVDRVVPERLLTPQVRFFVEAVLDAG